MAIFKIGDVVQGDGTRCMTVVGVMSDGYVTCSHSEDGDIRDTIWHESLLRIANYPDHWRSVSAGVELGSRPADLDAALAEVERLKRNAAAQSNGMIDLRAFDEAQFVYVATNGEWVTRGMIERQDEATKRTFEQLKATITERDDLARRLAEVEKWADGEIGSYKYMVYELRARIAELEYQPPVSQRQAANPAPAADSVAVPDQARAAGAAVSDEMTLRLVRPVNWDALAGYPVGEALPVTTAANTPPLPAGPCVRQPSDDRAIPPVPFNALRYSR